MVSTYEPQSTATVPASVRHPLDPLTAEEIRAASTILRRERNLAPSARFVSITLHEPAKETVLSFKEGDPITREAFIVVREAAEHKTYEAVVSLSANSVVSWRHLPGVQPSIMAEEFFNCEKVVRQNPEWQAAMRKRGVTDFDLALIDPWSVGYNGPEDAPEGRRLVRPLTWMRAHPTDHAYARPVENLIVLFDLDAMEVVRVDDHGVVPLPPRAGDYTPAALTDPNNHPHVPNGLRTDLKPIEIVQPDGASFEVDGHAVRWQKWRFRIGFTYREGLVLHTISYEDQGRERPIIYRASLSEMFIPYGDPRTTQYRKNVFDEGEYGIGWLTNSLELGCDCLGLIRYFDAVVNDNDGNPLTIPNAVCMHEEDYGILWKHTDMRTGMVEVRRSRRLVVSSIVTVGNYEYGFFWYFYQDGTIQYEVKLTGVVTNGAMPIGEKPRHGTLVAPGVYAPNHQHIFNVRLDMMVDGLNNSVYEVNSESVRPGPDNPYGNAWTANATLLARESEAQRIVNPLSARYWKIVNPSVSNSLGEPVAYKLMPGDNALPLYQPEAHAIKRAGYATKHLWATRYDPAERFAAGDYPNQHPGGAGLPAYTAADRPLENTDIVIWYTFSAHHIPRPEDWPVMPVTYIGFHLKPVGFFDGNPALDVPPSPSKNGACH